MRLLVEERCMSAQSTVVVDVTRSVSLFVGCRFRAQVSGFGFWVSSSGSIDSGLIDSTDFSGPLRGGYRESRRCSRVTYPESYITDYTSVRRLLFRVEGLWHGDVLSKAGAVRVGLLGPRGPRFKCRLEELVGVEGYRGTSLTRKPTPLGPYGRPMRRVIGGS